MDVIIIGAGAAGMAASIFAAGNGHKVTVFERNDRSGRKLSITGKGRCNLCNNCTKEEFFLNIPVNPRFMYSSYNSFDKDDTMRFFEEECGVPLKTERGSRVFPVSDKAADIVSALERKMREANVRVIRERVKELIIEDGCVKGVKIHGGSQYFADKVIVATGGMSYPKTGSTGDGYKFAVQAGHTIIGPKPSLVPLETKESWVKEAMGLSLRNVRLTLFDTKGKTLYSEQGEMLFTHFGVSGPLVLSASAHIKGECRLSIDLKPALDEKTLDNRILRDLGEFSNRELGNSLSKLLPKSLIPVVIRLAGLDGEMKSNSITREQRRALLSVIKGLPLNIKGFRPIDEAIITSGGVSVREIDPKTMESKLCKGLFFAGEVIDVNAYTGGFNLQIAFSTAHAAAV